MFNSEGLTSPFCFKFNSIENELTDYIQFSDNNDYYSKSLSLLYKDNLKEQVSTGFDIYNARITDNYRNIRYSYMYDFLHKRFQKVINEETHYSNAKLSVSFKVDDKKNELHKRDAQLFSINHISRAMDTKVINHKENLVKRTLNIQFIEAVSYYKNKSDFEGYMTSAIKQDIRRACAQIVAYYDEFKIDINEISSIIDSYDDTKFDMIGMFNCMKKCYLYIFGENINNASEKISSFVEGLTNFQDNCDFALLKNWIKLIEDDSSEIEVKDYKISLTLKNTLKVANEFFKEYDNNKDKEGNTPTENKLISYFDFSIKNMSDGEEYFLKLFCKISQDISDYSSNYKRMELLFDEYELYLHPEWCRQLLARIIDELGKHSIKFTIIIASHSPFIISDLPRKNVIILDTDKQGNCIENKTTLAKTFATNIHSLYNEGMFMSSTYGEISRRKIESITKQLKEMKEKKEPDLNERETIKCVIDQIGDDLTRMLLKITYDEIYSTDDFKIKKSIDKMSNKEKSELIAYLEKDNK